MGRDSINLRQVGANTFAVESKSLSLPSFLDTDHMDYKRKKAVEKISSYNKASEAKRKITSAKTADKKMTKTLKPWAKKTRNALGILAVAFVLYGGLTYCCERPVDKSPVFQVNFIETADGGNKTEVQKVVVNKEAVKSEMQKDVEDQEIGAWAWEEYKDIDFSKANIRKPFTKETFLRAIAITSSFEGNRGYKNYSNNFDGAGGALGARNETFLSGNAQKSLKKMNERHKKLTKRIMGDEYNSFVTMLYSYNIDQQVKWAANMNEKTKERLVILISTPEGKEVQNEGIIIQLEDAQDLCLDNYGITSEAGFILVYDVLNQNGQPTLIKPIAKKMSNAERIKIVRESAIIGSKKIWRPDVRDRKDTISRGYGVVHGKGYRLREDYGVSYSTERLEEFKQKEVAEQKVKVVETKTPEKEEFENGIKVTRVKDLEYEIIIEISPGELLAQKIYDALGEHGKTSNERSKTS